MGNEKFWKLVEKNPPPDRDLVLLHGNSGRMPGYWGLGYFDKGVHMEKGEVVVDWTAVYWSKLPMAPSTYYKNYEEGV